MSILNINIFNRNVKHLIKPNMRVFIIFYIKKHPAWDTLVNLLKLNYMKNISCCYSVF